VSDYQRSTVETVEPGGLTGWVLLARLVRLLFGILQVLLILRIVLLLLGADQANVIVSDINSLTAQFVAPFRGIFKDYVLSAGSVLDVAAVVAFVGWTLVEALVLGVIGIVGRTPAQA
jgi:uncharacterized protein YggT (Ycf19 family)